MFIELVDDKEATRACVHRHGAELCPDADGMQELTTLSVKNADNGRIVVGDNTEMLVLLHDAVISSCIGSRSQVGAALLAGYCERSTRCI